MSVEGEITARAPSGGGASALAGNGQPGLPGGCPARARLWVAPPLPGFSGQASRSGGTW